MAGFRGSVAVLLLATLVASIAARCSDDAGCKGHGTCVHNFCRCEDGYAGDDCSIEDEYLEDDAAGTIQSFHWKYYHFIIEDNDHTAGVAIKIRQVSAFGDVDAYIQRDAYPTQRYFLLKVWRSGNISFEIENPSAGVYYVGLYGYWTVQYEIEIDIQRRCSIDCGEHGTCHRADDTCNCDKDWAGELCDIYQVELVEDVPFSGSINTAEWMYFSTDVEVGDHFEVVLTHGSNVDIDIYAKESGRPSWFSYDAFNTSLASESFLVIPRTDETARWFIGLYGFIGGDFTLIMQEGPARCASDCSMHGTCADDLQCSCFDDYHGGYCQYREGDIEYDEEYRGTVAQGAWNYYTFSAFTQNDVDIILSSLDSGDCQVMVNNDARPSITEFEFTEFMRDGQDALTVTIVNPMSANVWHIGVFGWTYCTYSLVLSEPECDCSSASHGSCYSSNICVCDYGWAGPQCDNAVQTLQNGMLMSSQRVRRDRWTYFEISLQESTALFVSMKEQLTVGRLGLYVSLDDYPLLDRYDYKEQMEDTELHELHVNFRSPQTRAVFIGVYGTPALVDQNGYFSITAWSPDF